MQIKIKQNNANSTSEIEQFKNTAYFVKIQKRTKVYW